MRRCLVVLLSEVAPLSLRCRSLAFKPSTLSPALSPLSRGSGLDLLCPERGSVEKMKEPSRSLLLDGFMFCFVSKR